MAVSAVRDQLCPAVVQIKENGGVTDIHRELRSADSTKQMTSWRGQSIGIGITKIRV